EPAPLVLVRRCALNEDRGATPQADGSQAMTQPSFATRWNQGALEDAYQRWRNDPNSVDESWRLFFEGFELGTSRSVTTADACAQMGIVRLINAYRELGHFIARLDPLSDARLTHPHLELSEFGLRDTDLNRVFDTSPFRGLPQATLRELLGALRETY